ncbi:MAG TPA: acyl-CoA dehydrogenase family protein [Acidimicrobiales bacterium]|nr:acyl-CoA dehydrogenase family protein [Acidimicrobiales bacterium]
MHLEETPGQLALRAELRAYFAELLTPEVRHALDFEPEGGETFRRVVRRMGTDGWLGIGWPVEYGGQGRPATDQFIFFTEVQRARAPFPFVTLSTVGPMIINHGTEEQKKFFLSGILAGEINCAIGYTEPGSGTDLASLRTRAELDGDEWVVNGNKIFTSGADQADYIWLACRTDPDAPKHKGISILLVPTATPGFSCTPIVTVGGVSTTASYYDDVRVPKDALIGELHGGWRLITGQLNHERVGLAAVSALAFRLWDETAAWVEERGLADVGWIQADLAYTYALLEAQKLLTWRMTAAVASGTLGAADSSSVKVFGTESTVDIYHKLLGIVGSAGYLSPGSPGAALQGELERAGRQAQINTFGGGVNEIQREILATAGLGMKRGAR